MRIVLYQPPTEATRAYLDATGREQTWLPHGLLCVAGVLDDRLWEICLIDGRLQPNGALDDLHIRLQGADVLACSVMTGHAITWALRASGLAKESGISTIWGGPHPTLFPIQTLSHPLVDYIVGSGRGEETFGQWARAFASGEAVEGIPGLGYKHDSTPILTPRPNTPSRPRDDFPPPRLDLLADFSPYLMDDPAISPMVTNHVTSLGCPYACTFCSEPTLSGRNWFAWSATRSFQEVQRLVAASGATGIKLHDALFFVDMRRGLEFARRVTALNIRWAATMHPVTLSKIDRGTLSDLRRSGLSRLMVGLESGNQQVVDLVGKRFSVRAIPTMASKLRDADIIGMFSMVVGFPTADPSEYSDTIRSAHEIHRIWDRHQVKIHYASPWPGTTMWESALTVPGFTPPADLLGWASYDYYLAQMVFHDRSWTTAIDAINRAYCPYYHA